MATIAAGATVFSRAEKVADLLASVGPDSPIDRFYVADNGELTARKREIYGREYPFDLEVLDVEYDAGLGRSRAAIVEASEAPFLLVVDNDVEIPDNVGRLHDVLSARPDLGGVGGVLIEGDSIRSDCHDLHERGSLLVKDIREPKPIEAVAGLPVVAFDQIQNVALYRRECLEDYTWDPEYVIGWEHADFFLAHKQRTEWAFAVTPQVLFRHYPGGHADYTEKRRDYDRNHRTKQYFLEKWGYDQVLYGQTRWLGTTDGLPSTESLLVEVAKNGLLALPPGVQAPLMDLRDRWRKLRGRKPF